MRAFTDAKAMARSLEQSLRKDQAAITHGRALEIVARQFGVKDWNTLAATIASAARPESGPLFEAPIPILRIFSVEKVREFYGDYLGFSFDWEHRYEDDFPLYTQISRAGLTLHLSEHHGDASPGSAVFLPMRGLDAFHAELAARDYRYMKPGIRQEPWGRSFEVTDPFSNKLRCSERDE